MGQENCKAILLSVIYQYNYYFSRKDFFSVQRQLQCRERVWNPIIWELERILRKAHPMFANCPLLWILLPTRATSSSVWFQQMIVDIWVYTSSTCKENSKKCNHLDECPFSSQRNAPNHLCAPSSLANIALSNLSGSPLL